MSASGRILDEVRRDAAADALPRCIGPAWLWHPDARLQCRARAQAGPHRLRHGLDRHRPDLSRQGRDGDRARCDATRSAQSAARRAIDRRAVGDRLRWFCGRRAASGRDARHHPRDCPRRGPALPPRRAACRSVARHAARVGACGGGERHRRHAGADRRRGERGRANRRPDGHGPVPPRAGRGHRRADRRPRLRHGDLRLVADDARLSHRPVRAHGEDHRVCLAMLPAGRARLDPGDAG